MNITIHPYNKITVYTNVQMSKDQIQILDSDRYAKRIHALCVDLHMKIVIYTNILRIIVYYSADVTLDEISKDLSDKSEQFVQCLNKMVQEQKEEDVCMVRDLAKTLRDKEQSSQLFSVWNDVITALNRTAELIKNLQSYYELQKTQV